MRPLVTYQDIYPPRKQLFLSNFLGMSRRNFPQRVLFEFSFWFLHHMSWYMQTMLAKMPKNNRLDEMIKLKVEKQSHAM